MIIALYETMDLNTNGWKTENHILLRNSIVILGFQLKVCCHLWKGWTQSPFCGDKFVHFNQDVLCNMLLYTVMTFMPDGLFHHCLYSY